MEMTNPILISIAAVVMVVIALVAVHLLRPRKKTQKAGFEEYAEALNFVISGENSKALDKLREAVKKNTANIDGYIKIGDLLRELGKPEQAAKVHLDLTVRANLTTAYQIAIWRSLVHDYHILNDYDRALRACDKLLSLRHDDPWTLAMKIQLLEEKGDWISVFDILKRNRYVSKAEKRIKLSFYKVEEGRVLASEGKEHEARMRFREAIKLNPEGAPAYLEISDSYLREERYSDALNMLKRYVRNAPKLAYLAFDHLKQILFEIGHFSEIESIYNDLLKVDPDNLDARLALAAIFEKKGEYRQAIDLCQQVLEHDPTNLDAKLNSIRFHTNLGHNEAAIELVEQVADELLRSKCQYKCKECGNKMETYFWHCSHCGAWDSAIKEI
jgi:lipopolysaccharide biosynthesis regulator YciM